MGCTKSQTTEHLLITIPAMKTLSETAEQYIKDHPRCRIMEIAAHMSLSAKRAGTLVSQLEADGKAYRTRIPGSKACFLTHGVRPASAHLEPLSSGMPKQVIVGEWEPPAIAPQSWLSALGL